MGPLIIQIYEIQQPGDVQWLVELGVDHIGSVLLSESDYKKPLIKETVSEVAALDAVSTLIPLFNTPDNVYRALDYYQPKIVHFCEALDPKNGDFLKSLTALQEGVKKRFEIKIMRSIPIGLPGMADLENCLELARVFAPSSDFFLTDTLMGGPEGSVSDQPVSGFVGITGKICDWDVAKALVEKGGLPVILAGGVSPGNVAEGVKQVSPAGVDSCTQTNRVDKNGVPIRFQKDRRKVADFVASARATGE